MKIASYIYFSNDAPTDLTQLWAKPVDNDTYTLQIFNNGAWRPLIGNSGKSAYELAVEKGFVGTFEEWLETMKGPKGDTGETGPAGPQGPQGETGKSIASINYSSETPTETIYIMTFTDNSTYAFSIPKGQKGDPGEDGADGKDGKDGQDGTSFTYADLTAAQKAELAQDATAAAQQAAGHLATIQAALDGLDPSQSTEDAITALTAQLADTQADVDELSPKIDDLDEQINGVEEGTVEELLDISQIERQNIYIDASANKWYKSAGWYSIFVPVSQEFKYVITAGELGVTRYAFMTSDSYTDMATVSTYATNYSATLRVEIGESTQELEVPSNAQYLYILVQIGSGETGVSLTRILTIHSQEGLVGKIQGIETSLQKDVSESVDMNSIVSEYCFINGNDYKWNIAAGWLTKFIPLQGCSKCMITAGTDILRYTFLKDNAYTINSSVTTFATNYNNVVPRLEAGESSGELSIPLDATYLYILSSIGNGDTGAKVMLERSIERINSTEEKLEKLSPAVTIYGSDDNQDLQTIIDSMDGDNVTINIDGEIHLSSAINVPAGKSVRLIGGALKGSFLSLGVSRKDSDGVAKVYVGENIPQWIEVDGVPRYPASTQRNYPYKATVVTSGSSNSTVTVEITVPVEDAVKLAEADTSDSWVTLLVEWMSAKLRIDSINTSTGVVTCTFNQGTGSYHDWSGQKRVIFENINIESSLMNASNDTWAESTYYVENGFLYYKYGSSETAPNIEIPAIETLIESYGHLTMEGVSVSCTSHSFDDLMGEGTGHGYRSFQSGFVMNGAIEIYGSANIDGCRFFGTTNNCIRVNNSAVNVIIANCSFKEVGCDAILVGVTDYVAYNKGDSQTYVPSDIPANVTITGNSVYHPGRIYQEATAIVVAYARNFSIKGNVISDTYYSGISTGCDWAATSTQKNYGGIISGNLLKNIGIGGSALCDGAAIYNLGDEKGLIIEKNIITDVYGGKKGSQNMYAIFFDQGTKNVVFRKNLVYDVYGFSSINISGSGKNAVISNNVFAFPKYAVTDYNESLSSCFQNNIFAWSGNKTNVQTTTGTYVKNLYYRYDSTLSSISFDTQSVIGNPGFRDADNYDFAIIDTTNTEQAGFVPFAITSPSASLVERTRNNASDEALLNEWIARWEAGTI